MSSDKNTFKRQFLMMLGGYALVPLSFILMGAGRFNGPLFMRILAYSAGGLFWSGTAIGTLFLILADKRRKKDENKGNIRGLPGVLRFFSCRQGKLMDLIMILTTLCVLGVVLTGIVNGNARFFFYGAWVLTFILHAVFNGKNYSYLKIIMKG